MTAIIILLWLAAIIFALAAFIVAGNADDTDSRLIAEIEAEWAARHGDQRLADVMKEGK
jgi:hypothetical protein